MGSDDFKTKLQENTFGIVGKSSVLICFQDEVFFKILNRFYKQLKSKQTNHIYGKLKWGSLGINYTELELW